MKEEIENTAKRFEDKFNEPAIVDGKPTMKFAEVLSSELRKAEMVIVKNAIWLKELEYQTQFIFIKDELQNIINTVDRSIEKIESSIKKNI